MKGSWKEQLEKLLIERFGPKKGSLYFQKYSNSFPASYIDEYSVEMAVKDIHLMEQITDEHPIQISFYYYPKRNPPTLHLRLFQRKKPIPLSDILPMLENLDLRVDSEHPFEINCKANLIWISDFIVIYSKSILAIDQLSELFEVAFSKVYFGLLENDGFNKLVLGAALSWREVTILRAYAKYLHQIGFRFTQPYIEKALNNNIPITKLLVELFEVLHNPSKKSIAEKESKRLQEDIMHRLDAVTSLDEDRIIRRILDLILATLRTNYYQTIHNKPKEYISIKFNSRAIPEMPLPIPLYDVFIYSPQFQGIHLRNTKVARGGIRWSDRPEDFRTEILGLMKAQTVKNSVIVPSGAKGGFIVKKDLTKLPPPERMKEGIRCYQSFIRGLLDITDNIVNQRIVSPKNVVCYDKNDPYLVVAADKGTATFSDIANNIAKEYNFWLGDAFASGGSTGYDHKKMGITARGTWESIKRHLLVLNIDLRVTPITVVGIGDMSGDVFGNGMLYSSNIKLIAAFDHRNIFIDPSPKMDVSYNERLRLFNLPTSSWEDYNPKLISKGGGVFKRSLKFIKITPEMQNALGIEDTSLTPAELIQKILRAPVDLLFNGGIGTFVKASFETQSDVGDRTNDYCRVNANELRCKMVGEGGNLGFTQLARIEYATYGGLIYTDFIDNSAGVDCSDHEVNLKILLDSEVNKGKLTETQRNKLLASLKNEVAELVLEDNFQQALLLSFTAFHAKENFNLHVTYLKELESQSIVKRKVEFLPTDKELMERKTAGGYMTRPELAVLLAYTKISLKNDILKTKLPEDKYINRIIATAFPASIRKKYYKAISEHRLHREIFATQVSNEVINKMGMTFIYRVQMETGANIEEIIRAYNMASHTFNTQELQEIIESLDYKIPLREQYEMLFNIRKLINLTTRWYLHSEELHMDKIEKVIDHYNYGVRKIEDYIFQLMSGAIKSYSFDLIDQFQELGLSKKMAQRIAIYRAIYTSLNIISISSKYGFDLIKTARVYFLIGEKLNIVWFRDQIANDEREGHWNTLARLTLRDELDIAQRGLTLSVLKSNPKENDELVLFREWANQNRNRLQRWDKILKMVYESNQIDYTIFFIAIRELIGLVILSLQSQNFYHRVSTSGDI